MSATPPPHLSSLRRVMDGMRSTFQWLPALPASRRTRTTPSGRAWWAALVTRIAVGSIVLWGVTVSASAQASRFRRVASRVQAFASDGVRYAAWQASESPTVVVLDTRTGRRLSITVPAECRLVNQEQAEGYGPPAGAARFLLRCGRSKALLDARSGTVTMLPANPAWITVGSQYLEGNGGACTQTTLEIRENKPCVALYNISTGAVSYGPQSQIVDLDRPAAPLICRTLRNTLGRERANTNSNLYSYSAGLLARAVKVGSASVQINRCHGKRTILHAHGEEAQNLDIRGGILTWDTGHYITELNETVDGTAYTFQLSTHRRHSWPLPRLSVPGFTPGAYGFSTHTANTIFWIATESLGGQGTGYVLSSAVYALPIPR